MPKAERARPRHLFTRAPGDPPTPTDDAELERQGRAIHEELWEAWWDFSQSSDLLTFTLRMRALHDLTEAMRARGEEPALEAFARLVLRSGAARQARQVN
jgi:hypothetical protein